MNLLEEFASAVARGVEVTILTNARDPIDLHYNWKFWETRDSGCGEVVGAGYRLVVRDCDGDSSWWELRRGREVLAKGSSYDWKPYYHFDFCCLEAERALRSEVKRRKTALLTKRQPLI
jgi:hypothetical protein